MDSMRSYMNISTALLMKTYAKNNVNIKDITPENKLDDSFYYLALSVGNAANKSKSAKNLLNFCIPFTIFLY